MLTKLLKMRHLDKKETKNLFRGESSGKDIIVVLENVQYARNVANIFRIADAARVSKLYLSGITTTPPFGKELKKVSRSKERSVEWETSDNLNKLIPHLKNKGYKVIALELTENGIPVKEIGEIEKQTEKLCLIVGNETYGVTRKTLAMCESSVYIPMYGRGGSLNVNVSLGIVLFSL